MSTVFRKVVAEELSTSKYKWYRDAVWVIRDYPALKARKRELQEQSLGVSYGEKIPGSPGISRVTENLALREMAHIDEARLEVMEQALAEIKALPDGNTVVRIVELIDWKRTHTVEGVALMMHFSARMVLKKREKLIKLVAKKCGWT